MKNAASAYALRIGYISAVLLLLGQVAFSAPSMKTVFDFESSPNAASWQIVNDDVMGGISRSSFTQTPGAAVFQGEVSLENNGGFASVRSAPMAHQLSGTKALVVRVRGDGKRYKLTLRTESGFDSPIYQCAFSTRAGVWEEHRLPLRQFVPTFRGRVLSNRPPLDPAAIGSVGFMISDKQQGPFRLEVAWIKAEQ